MNVELVLVALLSAAIATSVSLMLAAIGEAIGESSGILDLGIEGQMLASGLLAFLIARETGSNELGLLAGVGTGLALGFLFGLAATVLAADQIVLGLGLTLAGTGGTAFLFRERFGSDQPLLAHGTARPFDGLLDWIPVLGPALADQRWPVYVAWGLVAVAHLLLYRSVLGLRIRAAGELPFGLVTVGGDVTSTRILAASIGGACKGLAGSYLVVVELGFFTPGITSGIGFIAVAAAMLGGLKPLRIAAVALGFGILTGMDTGLQLAGVDIRPEFLQMLPYAGAVVALLIWGRRMSLPAMLGQAWRSR